MPMPTKTEFAKDATSTLVAMQATGIIRNLLNNNTEVNVNGIPVRFGCWIAGEFVAMSVRPLSDKAVDFTIAKFKTFKQNRKDRKTNK